MNVVVDDMKDSKIILIDKYSKYYSCVPDCRQLCGVYCNFSDEKSSLWWNINACDILLCWGEEGVIWKQPALSQILGLGFFF